MKLSSIDVPTIRAAGWAYRACRRVDADLTHGGIDDVDLPAVPDLPPEAIRGVRRVLRQRSATCLVRALVLQRWYFAHGESKDLIIGVTAPSSGFQAHAWLQGDPPCHEGYTELARRSVQ